MRPCPPSWGGFHVPQRRIHTSHTHTHYTHITLSTHSCADSHSCPITGGSWGWRWVHEERVSQAARQRSVLCRVSARCGEAQQNCRSPRPRFEYALRAYWGRARPRGGVPPPLLMFYRIPWPTRRSPAPWWGRYRFHPFTYPEPYRHGISLRENTESIRML